MPPVPRSTSSIKSLFQSPEAVGRAPQQTNLLQTSLPYRGSLLSILRLSLQAPSVRRFFAASSVRARSISVRAPQTLPFFLRAFLGRVPERAPAHLTRRLALGSALRRTVHAQTRRSSQILQARPRLQDTARALPLRLAPHGRAPFLGARPRPRFRQAPDR